MHRFVFFFNHFKMYFHLAFVSWHTSWIILLFTGLGVLFVFDPMGSRFFSTAHSLAVKVWERRLRLLCCCLPQDESYQAVFLSIAQLFSGYFSVSFSHFFYPVLYMWQ